MNYKVLIAGVTLITLGTYLLSRSEFKSTSLQEKDLFNDFTKKYEKSYNSLEEKTYRYTVFLENKKLVDEHNKKESSYTMELNHFSDLTWEEFKSAYLSSMVKEDDKSKCEKDPSFFKVSEEDKVDWQERGVVQKVKNQGMCGSCWAFSTVGALESALAIKSQTNEVPNLSEQELVDCSKPYGNQGCNGGLMNLGFDYVLEHHLNTEDAYPYLGREQACKTDTIGEGSVNLQRCVRVPADTTGLTNALRTQPVSVAFYVNAGFQFYFGGIYDPWFCNGEPNHGVLAVGFDLTNSKPFYKVKNSWGSSWGENGFFRIAIGKKAKGTCDIAGNGFNFVPVV